MFIRLLKKARGNSLIKSMSINLLCKPVGMIISYVYTPLLIMYLGNEKYGIWVTLLSVINWIGYFDIGIGSGLRNIITRDIEERKFEESKVAVSTAYRVMIYITGILLAIVLLLGSIINWNAVLNTNVNVSPVVLISFVFICVNFLLSLFKVEYYAIHKSEAAALSGIFVQVINLAGIIILSRVETGQLVSLAILFGFSSLAVNVAYSIGLWRRYDYLKPGWNLFDRSKLKEICGMGFKFFFLQISAMTIFTTDNLIITGLYGPELVTPYSMAYKVFNIFNCMLAAMSVPLWAEYTVAKTNNNYIWIKTTLNRMTLLLIPTGAAMAGAVLFFQPISDWWLGRHLVYQNGLVIAMALYMFAYMYSSIYSIAMNGMGNINLQLAVAVAAAAVNIPLSIYLAWQCGLKTVGVCLATLITMVIANIIYTIHVKHIIDRELKKQ